MLLNLELKFKKSNLFRLLMITKKYQSLKSAFAKTMSKQIIFNASGKAGQIIWTGRR